MEMLLVDLGKSSLRSVFGQVLIMNRHTLMPPTGYHVAGIAGSCADWLDSFQLIVTH